MVRLARRPQLLDDAADRVGRDREADADVAARPLPVAGDSICELTPITLPGRIQQRAAGVAGVERRVGLDDVADREAVGRVDLALQRADDAGGQRPVEAERVADRIRRVADLDAVRVAERQRRRSLPPVSTFSSARSVEASVPTIFAV